MTGTNLKVPTINVAPLLVPGSTEEDVSATIAAIGSACAQWGFFYAVGHQVDKNFIQDVQRLCREFFEKPREFKQTVARTATNFHGFSDAEFTLQKLDWKEVFDFGAQEAGDGRNLDVAGENQWPESMPDFKTAMLRYFDEMHGLAEKLMGAIFESLGGDAGQIEQHFKDSRDTSLVRMNFYPICPDPRAHLGVGPHADPSALTILWQDMDVSSLQVEKDGQFYNVEPIADSFVVNIGDMIQVFSNGLYKAPVHRVLANHQSKRYSSPFFFSPSYSCDVKPLPSCITPDNPCRYRPINWGHFRKGRFEGDYADVGEEIQIRHFLINN